MKKIVSMILALATCASLAVGASAHSMSTNFVEHNRPGNLQLVGSFTDLPGVMCQDENAWDFGTMGGYVVSSPDQVEYVVLAHSALPALSSQHTKIVSITEGTKQSFVSCKQAITSKQMEAAAAAWNEANELQVKHLTVWKQRMVQAEGEIELSVKLWDTSTKEKRGQSTVILYTVDGEEWTIAEVAPQSKDASAVLPAGTISYAVCLAWK